jgi:hypothetical protein
MSESPQPVSKDRILRGITVLRQRFDPPPSKATVHRWIKKGVIPPPFDFNGRPAWRESEIEAFIANCTPKYHEHEDKAATLA